MDFALFLILTRTYQNLMHLGGYMVCHDLKVGHFHILWLVPVHIFRSQNMSGFHLVLCQQMVFNSEKKFKIATVDCDKPCYYYSRGNNLSIKRNICNVSCLCIKLGTYIYVSFKQLSTYIDYDFRRSQVKGQITRLRLFLSSSIRPVSILPPILF